MIHLEVSDHDRDDFAQGLVAVRATQDDVSRTWKIPRRLMMRTDIASLIVEELLATVADAREVRPRGR